MRDLMCDVFRLRAGRVPPGRADECDPRADIDGAIRREDRMRDVIDAFSTQPRNRRPRR